MRKALAIAILLIAVSVWLLAHAGSFLVLDAPRKSDVMLVLASDGEPDRFLHAVELLKQGYADHILLDIQKDAKMFDVPEIAVGQQFIDRVLPGRASICSIAGDSTYEETVDALKCMEAAHATSVLIVTSDFHTRRAFSIFRKRLPKHDFAIGATRNPRWFSREWWTRRRWAKTTLDEWEKLIWWEMVDRWHRDVVLE